MGNPIPITGTTTSTIQVAAERPTFLQCNIADYSALDTAVSRATVATVCTVNIATTPIVGGVQVTLTGASPTPVDGIVDLFAAASTTPKGWPAAQHFQGLALGQSQSFTFVVPAKAAIGQVRVRCGDRRMTTTTVALHGPLAQEILQSTLAVDCIAFLRDVAELSQLMRSTCVGSPPPTPQGHFARKRCAHGPMPTGVTGRHPR